MTQASEPAPTRLESADEVLKALEARKAQRRKGTGAKGSGAPPAPAYEPRRERPAQRPPMALLCVYDDASQAGEVVRLRADRTVIGRSEGDVVVPHDPQMSGRHAEVVREGTPSGHRWVLRDLGSTNGTFVRIGSHVLRHDNELLIGQGRYRFESAGHGATADATTAGETSLPRPGVGRALVPSLVEVAPDGPVQRHLLTLPEYWVGHDRPEAAITRPDDPYVDARHARLHRDRSGQWHVSNNASLNGLWLRVKVIGLDRACQFRLGEQRFLFRVC